MKIITPILFVILYGFSFGQNNLNCEITTEWEYLQNSICADDSIGVFSHMHDSYYFEFIEGAYDTIILNNSQSIQGCLDTVSSGKVILLEDGIYYENIVWPITNQIILSSLNGPENCIIDGSNANESVIYLGNGNSNGGIYDPNATFIGASIQNIQIRNGYGSIPVFHNSIRFGGGILIDEYMKVVVSNCIIHNNGFGPGTNGGNPYSGGMFVSYGSEAYLFNNTITDNIGSGIWWRSRHDNFDEWTFSPADWPYGVQGCAVNNVFANNGGYGMYLQNGITKNSLQIRYNNSYGNGGQYTSNSNWYDGAGASSYTETAFNGNISLNPLFTDQAFNDYSLQLTSPSVGSGQLENDMGYQGSFELFNDPITYGWSNGEISESFTYFPQSTQDLILTMSQGSNTCSDTIVIDVIHSEVPVFEYVDDLFAGEYYDLPNTSLNNITGFWDPSAVDTNITSLYTFYPDGTVPCVPIFQMTINIKPTSKLFVNAFIDEIQNCELDVDEERLGGVTFELNGFNTVFQTTEDGIVLLDSIPDGTYQISIDTTNLNWQSDCGFSQSFQIINGVMQDTINFGIFSSDCTEPNISIFAPTLRRCFSNQMVYVSVTNANTAALSVEGSFVDVTLNPFMNVTGSSIPYTSQGNNIYRFEIDTLVPGDTLNFNIATYIPCSAQWNSTLCMSAELTPYGICVLDTIPSDPIIGDPTGIIPTNFPEPCVLPWDQSSLSVEGWCQNDTVYFSVTNTGEPGEGDMECFTELWVTRDGVVVVTDSIALLGGETTIFSYPGEGYLWKLMAEQHPLHPGNSHPNAHVELCGDTLNFTPNMVNQFPLDDADPIIDQYCGIVTGSYDPNDKTGFPLGETEANYVQPNQQFQYVVRFQNTGNDTAFTVIIRDTLDLNLNLFTVSSGVSSHPYTFKMYGPRVLEWTFNNILLPDSTTNLEGSNGFVTFQVEQIPDLPPGTVIPNDADIYFDFNLPITTNTTIHRVFEGFVDVLDPTVSIENYIAGEVIDVYPNPTTNLITIQSESVLNNKFKIYDQQGREVMNGKLTGKNTVVSLGILSRGTYTIKVEGNFKPAVIIKE
ncbi:T9SS type A sorting domain-containing protein [Crocinitomicaceae bacterium]|nr:T9SS type A sorting domain-containing protein [Crocinitomicaceae bacterium]